jgi:hypothetical protein
LSPSAARPESRLGAAALVALLIVSLALGIYVFRARTPDLALEVTSFPKELDERGLSEITFFVRFDEPAAKVEIVGQNQVVARTLAPSIALSEDESVTCAWDGFDDEGDKVEPGRYRLRVTLPEQDRVMVFPRRLDVQPGAKEEYELVLGEPCAPGEAE